MTIITPTGITGINSITSTGETLQFQTPSGANVSVNGLEVASGSNINVSGIVTASGGFSGNITGNVNATGISTITTLNATSLVGVTTAYVNTLSGISTIDASSAVSINQNLVFASGKGIDFSADSNAAGMTGELLSDYEEGTWTPVLVSRNSPSGSLTYTQNTGKYVKVGDLVYVSAYVIWNGGSIGGSIVQLSGLPFISGANRERGGLSITYSASGWITGATIYQQCFRSETNETNAIYNFSDTTDGKINSTIAGSQIASTGEFMVTGTYCVS